MLWIGVLLTFFVVGVVALVFLLAELARVKRDISAPPEAARAGEHDSLVSHWEAPGGAVRTP
ncbi:MAG: hypothetical protein WBV82_15965 [Myxococcaceae bacterium]